MVKEISQRQQGLEMAMGFSRQPSRCSCDRSGEGRVVNKNNDLQFVPPCHRGVSAKKLVVYWPNPGPGLEAYVNSLGPECIYGKTFWPFLMTFGPLHGSFLPRLRELHARGETLELIQLIQQLKKRGYPASILRTFERQATREVPLHPYRYDWPEGSRNLGQIVPSPLVSVIVVAYRSGDVLGRLLHTLQKQTYTHLELIIVNNGDENLQASLAQWNGDYHYVTAPNPGFAEANNIGLEKATGDLLLMLNPDTELQNDSIKELVHALEIDATAAAAVPLIYFAQPFYKLSLTSKNQIFFAIDVKSLSRDLRYKKFFVREGEVREDGLVYCNMNRHCSLDIPLNPDSDCLDLDVLPMLSHGQELCLQVQFEGSGENASLIYLGRQRQVIRLFLSKRVHSSSRYLINNAGSGVRSGTFEPYDIGFGEVDVGKYSCREYRQALCGCCVLLRRDLFIQRKLFFSEFFAYYEDSELSYWLQENHMNILYVPSAIIYHRHSEATVEDSPLWRQLVSRSENIYHSIRKAQDFHPLERHAASSDYPKICEDQSLIRTLEQYDRSLVSKTLEELISRSEKMKVGIYNSFWASMGGGERHALDVAEMALQSGCEVYLLSERHFSLDKLREFFQVSLSGVKTLISGEVTESLTQRFDIFVNSTFCSSLVSRAALSYFIVSFPHKNVGREFISSYKFLHNSEYTRKWAIRYWGEHQSKILLPILSFQADQQRGAIADRASELANTKDLLLLSVGRFNWEGHCKNQHIIARVFARLSKSGAIPTQWQLVMVGSVDECVESSISHFKETEKYLLDCNARLVANADMQEIKSLYHSAAVYIHATGLGVDPIAEPEKNEHFGIASFEALLHGCLLIAFEHGGPAVMVEKNRGSFIYRDESELEQKLLQAICHYEQEQPHDREDRISLNLEFSHGLIAQATTAARSLFFSDVDAFCPR
jgi:GT2 family glycosyltransferase